MYGDGGGDGGGETFVQCRGAEQMRDWNDPGSLSHVGRR
jgi:hypothetical protein